MHITILGAGAMGCLFGGLLAEAGHDVCLLDIWREHIQAIKRSGLFIESHAGTRCITRIHADTTPDDVATPEIVLVFVKSTATERAVQRFERIFASDTLIITLQNGLGNIDAIKCVVPEAAVVAGTTAHGATLVEAGRIRHAGQGPTVIGAAERVFEADVRRVAEILNQARITTTISENIQGIIWDKLLVNTGINALTAITRLRNGQLLEFSETKELLEQAVGEAWQVAQAKGILLNYVDPIAHTLDICRLTAENQSSMLQDILHGRQTEIDMINGAIVREALALGIEAPVNAILWKLVSVIEKLRS